METRLVLLTTFRVANISRCNSHFWALWLGPSGRYLWEKQNRTEKYDSTMFLKKQLVLHRHHRSSQVDKAPAWDGSVSLEKGPMKFPSGLLRARCPWRWTWIQKNAKIFFCRLSAKPFWQTFGLRPAPKRMVPGDTSLALEATMRRDDLKTFHMLALQELSEINPGGSNRHHGKNMKHMFIEGSQNSDNMERWKSEEKSTQEQEKEKELEERRYRRAKYLECHETLCFPMICGSGGSKSRLAKGVGAEPCGQRRNENCYTMHHSRTTFGSPKNSAPLRRQAHF